MTHPLAVLRSILSKREAPSTGVVQSIAPGSAVVRSKHGIVRATLNGFSVSPGQRVSFKDGSVVGVSPSGPLPEYEV